MKKLLVEEKIVIGFILCIVCLGILLPKGKASSFQFKPGDILITKSTAPGVSERQSVMHRDRWSQTKCWALMAHKKVDFQIWNSAFLFLMQLPWKYDINFHSLL